MSNHRKPMSLAISAAIASASLAAGSLFSMDALAHGYLQDAGKTKPAATEGKCGEGKCGAAMMGGKDAMYQELLPVQVLEADVLTIDFAPTSLVAMNFTLQFIPPEQRLPLLARIRQALLPGGALILSEKLCFADAQQQTLLNDLHIAFKRANGYSELEIAQKRSALENVMKPDSLEVHRQRLLEAGFSQVVPWFQCLNFASLVALP